MRGTRARLCGVVVALTVASAIVPASAIGAWETVATPSPGSDFNELLDVAANSASDVWAVGRQSDGNLSRTLVEHWDGSSWSVVPSPSPGADFNVLASVAAIAADDIWAVGYQHSAGGHVETLIEHWDGTTWSVVPSPNPGTRDNLLVGLTALGPDDIWAVGSSQAAVGPGLALTLHWDGTSWSEVPSARPSLTQFSALNAVSATAPDSVWAVGYWYDGTRHQTLVEHWDGETWTIEPSPSPYTRYHYPRAVLALDDADVWMGGVGSDSGGMSNGLLARRGGAGWSLDPWMDGHLIHDLAARAPDDIWAAGYQSIHHWDGTAWSIADTSDGGHNAIAVAGGDLWAVGARNVSGLGWRTYARRLADDAPATVTLAPASAVAEVSTSRDVTATVRSAGGDGLPDVTVRFTVSGSISTNGTCTTGASGSCSFTYEGPDLHGSDTIDAYADMDGDDVMDVDEPAAAPATSTWSAPPSDPARVTGNGRVLGPEGQRVRFSFDAESDGTAVAGDCSVDDPDGTEVVCVAITSVGVTGNTAVLFGTATVNGVPSAFRIDVVDGHGPPSQSSFAIELASGYELSGSLMQGNVKIR